MWLITNFGFFSIVKKTGESLLTIRSRAKKDLETLRDLYLPEVGEVVSGAGTDYQYRVRVSHEDFAEAMSKIVKDITYSNFKNSVARSQGSKRADLYHSLWNKLWRISEEEI